MTDKDFSQLDRVNQTITATYLKVETQYDVQMAFQENSETKLSDFFQVNSCADPTGGSNEILAERLFSSDGERIEK